MVNPVPATEGSKETSPPPLSSDAKETIQDATQHKDSIHSKGQDVSKEASLARVDNEDDRKKSCLGPLSDT
jgi:hypothetical protein